MAHPAQGRLARLRELLARRRGSGLGRIFTREVGEARIRSVVRWVADFSQRPLDQLRIADLGCHDGEMAIELARHGAEVVGLDARGQHVAAARRRTEELGLSQATFLHEDVRNFSPEPAEFDVVLCLGLLYHLPVEDVFDVTTRIASATRGFALFETQVSLSPRMRVSHDGSDYWGIEYQEDTSQPGASIDNPTSFWLTKPSLLNLLSSVGFASVAELLNPVILPLAAYGDHVTLLAAKDRLSRPTPTTA